MGPDMDGHQVVLIRGLKPIKARLDLAYENASLADAIKREEWLSLDDPDRTGSMDRLGL